MDKDLVRWIVFEYLTNREFKKPDDTKRKIKNVIALNPKAKLNPAVIGYATVIKGFI